VAGDADAAIATVGPSLSIVTVADPITGPSAARIVADPAAAGAVYSPLPSIDPTPLGSSQVNTGWLATASPNWSYTTAENCRVPSSARVTAAGVTSTDVTVCATTTLALLIAVLPPASTIATRNVYAPARSNVTVVALAPLVPLAENAGVAPAGAAVAVHVYVRFGSPPSSAPKTDRAVDVPVTAPGLAAAARATVGAASVTVAPAAAVTPPLVARITAVPAVAPAV
jgi:hypothetical protein